jgi:cytochrome c oxidase subunit 2
VLGVGVLALAGCAQADRPQSTMDPKGDYAQKIFNLSWPVFLIAGIVGVIVFVTLIVTFVRFRERPGHMGTPKQVHGNPALEIGLTVLPAVLLAAIAVPTIKVLFELNATPKDPLVVNVFGQQWWWEFDYPSIKGGDNLPLVTANEMVIPAGRQVKLNITSRDVIHSFWIPALNGKRDAVPGRVQPLNMEADAPGEFYGQCTEFCGLAHAKMRMRVVALSQADYDAWVANQLRPAADAPASNTDAVAGETIFKSQCSRCHTINGLTDANGQLIVSQANEQLVSGAAPNLTHLMSRTVFAGATYNLKRPNCTGDLQGLPTGTPVECLNAVTLSAWLRNPPALIPMDAVQNANGQYRGMPNLGLSEQQIVQLVAYLATLK